MGTAIVPGLVEELVPVNESVTYPVTAASEKRIRYVYIEATSTGATDTIALATYIPGITGVLGVTMNSVDAAASSTAPTWSSTTLTLAQHAGAGACKFILVVY